MVTRASYGCPIGWMKLKYKDEEPGIHESKYQGIL